MRISFLFVLLLIFGSACHQVTISSIKENVNESNNIPVVIHVDTNKVNIGYTLKPDKFFRYYDHDPFIDQSKKFIKKITLINEDIYQNNKIFLYVDKVARIYGGNYVHVKKIVQSNFGGKNLNKVVMKIYEVNEIDDLVQYHYWHKDREITVEDYEKISSFQDSISSNFAFDGLLYTENSINNYIILVNVFLTEKSVCNPCSDIDLFRENVKFDQIELLQRRSIKKEYERLENGGKECNPFKNKNILPELYPSLESLSTLDKIKDLDELKRLSTKINKEIETLSEYAHKRIPIRFNDSD